MWRSIWVACLCLVGLATVGKSSIVSDKFKDKTSVRILFGSCHSTKLRSPLWPHIVGRKPDIWIWGGDNMYADRMKHDLVSAILKFQLPFEEANETSLIQSYRELRADPGYTSLRNTGVEEIAIWDDHDYGINDGDRTYRLKDVSKKVFLSEMVLAPKDDPRWSQNGGIYLSRTFKTKTESIRVIGLDVRYSRDPWKTPKHQGDMLGEEQWTWLEETLCGDKTPRVNIIVSGLQILPENRGAGEAWQNFPNSRQRLFNLLTKCQVRGPLLLSGDVHMAELFEAKCNGGSILPEVTSSGMTHSWGTRSPGWVGEIAAMNFFTHALLRVSQTVMPWNYRSKRAIGAPLEGAYFLGLNFADINIDFEKDTIVAEIVDKDNKPALKVSYKLDELDIQTPGETLECGPIQGPESMVQLYLSRALVVFMFAGIPILFFVVYPLLLIRKVLGGVFRGDAKEKRE